MGAHLSPMFGYFLILYIKIQHEYVCDHKIRQEADRLTCNVDKMSLILDYSSANIVRLKNMKCFTIYCCDALITYF